MVISARKGKSRTSKPKTLSLFYKVLFNHKKFCNRVHLKDKTWKHPDTKTREENEERDSVEGSSDRKMGKKRKAPGLKEQTISDEVPHKKLPPTG